MDPTYPVILVGGDGGEPRLGEDEGAEVLRLRRIFRPLVDVHHVKPRLVAMHRVQYDLHIKSEPCQSIPVRSQPIPTDSDRFCWIQIGDPAAALLAVGSIGANQKHVHLD